ncbi:BON domain-containing protein [Gloeothece verrucosa]|uniref:Transport-associated protein n=1 Tax=Gloeothece verrucosa (strain PCC 7822) TaxID=497965 RepID=E0UHJ6_GLOV7|nr:BON domain-containing protein [Gloeothece verrucosa]ADN12137.1 transport-associated protein [Gloeothece verrucosa PCC 7822]
MKKIATVLLSSVLLVGAVACQDVSKTSSDSPDSPQASPSAPTQDTVKDSQEDAQSQVRRDQLNSDIRANEQRNNAFNGSDQQRSDDQIETEVRSKLEANIPKSQLAVEAEKGVVTINGTVPDQQDIQKIDPLAMQIKGVKSVQNKATYAPPTNDNQQNNQGQNQNKQ